MTLVVVPGADARRALMRRVRRVQHWLGFPVELSIVDDAAMTALCRAHLGKNKTTDVLSFSPEPPLPGLAAPVSGQIAVNADAVARQAPGGSPQAWLAEASSLVVHGAAHLAGHDHATRMQARAMLRLELRLARRLGLHWLPRPYRGLVT